MSSYDVGGPVRETFRVDDLRQQSYECGHVITSGIAGVAVGLGGQHTCGSRRREGKGCSEHDLIATYLSLVSTALPSRVTVK